MKIVLNILLLGLFASSLFAYVDSDMDGVEDAKDRCPNTSFSDLVDINGCTKKALVSPHHYDIIFGASYSSSDYLTLNATDTLSTNVQVDYYYKNFSLQASTAYFTTEGSGFSDSGLYDSFIGASYQFRPTQNLVLRLGAGALLPTYSSSLDNNNMDYTGSLNLSYSLDKVNLFGGYSYTIINDDDVNVVDVDGNTTAIFYQNTQAYSFGAGVYASQKLYVSAAYNSVNSVYETVEEITTASVYGYYSIDKHWFSTLSYAYGLSTSASDHYASIRFGYFF
ncbi:MAG: DUF3187 domain-containing protein [Sulfurimonas sp.]|nr:DUF3187 domain-containing protein [Sulfurimonas sp.]